MNGKQLTAAPFSFHSRGLLKPHVCDEAGRGQKPTKAVLTLLFLLRWSTIVSPIVLKIDREMA